MKCSSLSATCPLQRRARPPSRQRRGYKEGPKSRRFLHLAALSPTPDRQAHSRSRDQPDALELVLLHGPPHHHRVSIGNWMRVCGGTNQSTTPSLFSLPNFASTSRFVELRLCVKVRHSQGSPGCSGEKSTSPESQSGFGKPFPRMRSSLSAKTSPSSPPHLRWHHSGGDEFSMNRSYTVGEFTANSSRSSTVVMYSNPESTHVKTHAKGAKEDGANTAYDHVDQPLGSAAW